MRFFINIFSFAALSFMPLVVMSQELDVQLQNNIFENTARQWMCAELQVANPKHFVCDENKTTWVLPVQDSLSLFGSKIYVSPLEKESYYQILFPNKDCKRLIVLASLCDLYFPLFRKKMEAYGLHKDLMYLPLLLSGLNTNYTSKDGRSGLWALDYLAARKYHLRVDTLVDERMGTDFTTDAALKYFVHLAISYDNDYKLMIDAYRSGAPSVNKMLQQNGDIAVNSSESFYKFMAYTKFVVESCRIDNQLNNYFDIFAQYESIFFTESIKIKGLAEVLGSNLSDLQMRNPVYTGKTIEAGYRKIPFTLTKAEAAKYIVLKDSVAKWQPASAVIYAVVVTESEWQYHKVKKGETLGSIATKHRITVRKIKSWNHLMSDNLHIGQQLKIRNKELAKSKTRNEAEIENKSQADKTANKDSTLIAHETVVNYKVKKGDSLWSIAKKYKGVSPEQIKKWNKCGEQLKPGQVLKIYVSQ
jgi:membrane-bound lytic murein transglycosylase D